MVGRSGMRIRIEEASAHAGAEVEIRGWLYHKRSSGSIHFLLVRDGSGVIQAVMAKQEVSPSLFAAAADLTQESSLLVRGTVREDSRAPGGHELTVRDLQVVGLADPYPITPKERPRARSGVSTALGRRSGRRSPRPGATSRSSGCSNLRRRSWSWTNIWRSRRP